VKTGKLRLEIVALLLESTLATAAAAASADSAAYDPQSREHAVVVKSLCEQADRLEAAPLPVPYATTLQEAARLGQVFAPGLQRNR
jgi:hypothetical protein